MEQYYEQSVAGQKSTKTNFLYALIWLVIGICFIAAMLFASGIFVEGTSSNRNVLDVNWLSVLGTAVCLVVAGVLFVRKDYLRKEYDYILQGNKLEICGVMNRRRRKTLARIDLGSARMAGTVENDVSLPGENNLRKHKWYVQACRYYIIYIEDNIRHAALLEMDDHLAELIRRQLPVGVWRNEKGEITNHASLS